ncbi:hypothetical protein SVEN_6437 [Streptomyces venezuelae ATCC 10712]|uniref:Uncharacterized protein n=1 Tax=Streptomyces venezuelae (strain ATCC 10712 / CBS 650.69 / DSM 40230 / JCM 4526 / NBRC 13096 / PD 04745) TaxID=953739 RepID=F2RF38_STRVP|nr:hypothetical protein SVEN_6437 [Streptomyces venezuelae ATCC 10712]
MKDRWEPGSGQPETRRLRKDRVLPLGAASIATVINLSSSLHAFVRRD